MLMNTLITVGDVDMVKVNSQVPKGIVSNYNTSEIEYCNIVYMCIKQKGSSEYEIPQNLEHLVSQVLGDIYTLSPDLYDKDWTEYCYITIKKGYIQPNSFGNRDGFHIDGFKSDQRNFIWSDCDATPTEVAIGEFTLTDDHEKSLEDMLVQSSKCFKQQLTTNVLYDMNQQCVHRPTLNKTNEAVLRTFIKITFSKELFNCYGNAWNYKLPYIKPSTHRSECRNHTVR